MTSVLVVAPTVVTEPPRWRLGTRPGLDGLRAVAVVLVVLCHTHLWGFQGGAAGVDVFFVLSGFLITSLLLEELADTGRIRLGRFWARRLLRLYPALLVMVAVVAALMPLMPAGTSRGILPTLLYFSDWSSAFGPELGAFGHTWSLAIEEQFYLLWPLLLLGLWKGDPRLKRALQLVLLVALAVAVRRQLTWEQMFRDPSRIYYGFDFRADGLLIGCALGLAMHAGMVGRWLHSVWMLAVAGLAVVAVLFVAVVPLMDVAWWNRSVVALATAVVIAAVCAGTRGALWLSAPALRWVGLRSYGLYLWHYPIFAVRWRYAPLGGVGWLWTGLAVAVAFGACALSYRFVERPFLRLKYRLRSVQDHEGSRSSDSGGASRCPAR